MCENSCVSYCKSCDKTSGVCTECNSDYYLYVDGASTTCVQCNELGKRKFVSAGGKDTCENCVGNCKICDSSALCSKCNPDDPDIGVKVSTRDTCECCDIESDKVLVGDYCYSGTDCGANCKRCNSLGLACAVCQDTYFLTADGQCNLCPTGCTACTIAGACSACTGGLYLLNGRCVACTEDGQSISGLNCLTCSVHNCKRCSSEGICIECRSGFWLQSDDCCVECESGNRQYSENEPILSYVVKKCASCTQSNCLYCQTNEATCTRCNYPRFLKGGSCETCTDSGEIQKTTLTSGGDTCQCCVDDCAECTE